MKPVLTLSLFALVAPVAVTAAMGQTPPTLVAAPVYADGTYTGTSEDAYYGNVQMAVTISGGQVAGFKLLDYPRHSNTSVMINRQALPILAQEVITAQSANVDIVTGATLSSEAFIRSLGNAFAQAETAAAGGGVTN